LTCLTFRNWSNSADKLGEIKSNKKLMAQAEELDKELVAGCNKMITS
jgi:hypothetical protein